MITDERTAAFIYSMEPEKSEVLMGIEKEAVEGAVPIVKRPTQSLLRFLVNSFQPEHILEVGCAVGFSAILMNECQDVEGHITTIEKVPERIQWAKKNFARAGREKAISLLEGDAAWILADLAKKEKDRYDFIFMDAAKGQYMKFLPDVLTVLKPGGTLVSDNVLKDGEILESRFAVTRRDRTIHLRMREYLYTLTHSECLDTVILPLGDGVAVSHKKREKAIDRCQ